VKAQLEYLLFRPYGDVLWLNNKLDDIPSFLLHVGSLRSDEHIDEIWVHSKIAKKHKNRAHADETSSRIRMPNIGPVLHTF
jgi:hypothetical protein